MAAILPFPRLGGGGGKIENRETHHQIKRELEHALHYLEKGEPVVPRSSSRLNIFSIIIRAHTPGTLCPRTATPPRSSRP